LSLFPVLVFVLFIQTKGLTSCQLVNPYYLILSLVIKATMVLISTV
jgi:hypothetical protein